MARLNKKILCFVDEHGTAGGPDFALGCVIVWSHECGKVDKAFSDLLPATVNEVHAANWKKEGLQGLLHRFAATETPAGVLMLNKKVDVVSDDRPTLYALAIIEVAKIAIKRFGKAQRIPNIGNVEVIIDANDQNRHENFRAVIDNAKRDDGRFRAVTNVIALDSAASRLLQLADVVAHARTWIHNDEFNAKGLKDTYGIDIV